MTAGRVALRVCVIGERLGGPPDEGRKKFVHRLTRSLANLAEVCAIAVGRTSRPIDGFRPVTANRLFASGSLLKTLRDFAPDLVCYVPYASGTLFSFVRCAVLRAAWPRARHAMVLLQPREHGALVRWLLRFLKPDVILVQDGRSERDLKSLGCCVQFLPSGVDLEEFSQVDDRERAALRTAWGFSDAESIVLHVGHVKSGRNVTHLARLNGRCRPVLVGSASTLHDPHVADYLRQAGVLVLRDYIEDIRSVYRAADCFVFPVESERDSIGVPLSVLEAMACNLPVVSTRFGGLPRLFDEGDGLLFVDSPDDLPARVAQALASPSVRTRQKVAAYSWSSVARGLLTAVGVSQS